MAPDLSAAAPRDAAPAQPLDAREVDTEAFHHHRDDALLDDSPVLRRRGSGFHDEVHLLGPLLRARHADHDHGLRAEAVHAWFNEGLDLARRQIAPIIDDDLLLPPCDEQLALGEVAQVAGSHVAEGQLFVTGRKKEIIIYYGRNLAPSQVEALVE